MDVEGKKPLGDSINDLSQHMIVKPKQIYQFTCGKFDKNLAANGKSGGQAKAARSYYHHMRHDKANKNPSASAVET